VKRNVLDILDYTFTSCYEAVVIRVFLVIQLVAIMVYLFSHAVAIRRAEQESCRVGGFFRISG